ncbi:2221_t:CDS:2, partial [Acaulospora colombiana]
MQQHINIIANDRGKEPTMQTGGEEVKFIVASLKTRILKVTIAHGAQKSALTLRYMKGYFHEANRTDERSTWMEKLQ